MRLAKGAYTPNSIRVLHTPDWIRVWKMWMAATCGR
jgi:hypothetical protein